MLSTNDKNWGTIFYEYVMWQSAWEKDDVFVVLLYYFM